jgi:hypothetical protein
MSTSSETPAEPSREPDPAMASAGEAEQAAETVAAAETASDAEAKSPEAAAASRQSAVEQSSRAMVLQPYVRPRPHVGPPPQFETPARSRVSRLAMPAIALALAVALGWLGASYSGLNPAEDTAAADTIITGSIGTRTLPMATQSFAAPGTPGGDWVGNAVAMAGSSPARAADIDRLAGELRQLRHSLDTVKDGTDRSRQSADKARQETVAKLAAIAERLDKFEHGEREAAAVPPKSAPAAAPIPVPAPERQGAAPAPATTALAAAVPQPAERPAGLGEKATDRPTDRPAILSGWVVRDVYAGVALIEGRNGLLEVGPGQKVPGAGRVQGVRRQGRDWVVVTDRGVIPSDRW